MALVLIFMDQSKKGVNHTNFLISVYKIFQATKTTKLKYHKNNPLYGSQNNFNNLAAFLMDNIHLLCTQ